MIITIKDAAEYLRTGKAIKVFLDLIRGMRKIFTFKQERENRPVRYLEVVKAYEKGMMVDDILEKYGCSRATICRYAAMAGLPKRHWRPKDEDQHAKILELSKAGLTQDVIAKQCNCSPALVRKVEKTAGIKRTRSKMTKKKAYQIVTGKENHL